MNGSAGPALTARGWAALGCGLAAIVFGRLFGSPEISLLGAALVAAVLLARVWVGRSGGPHIAVRTLPAFAHAGESVRVALELRPLEGARGGRGAFREASGGPACALRPVTGGGLRVLRGSYEVGPLARGLHELGAGLLVREDPFGLARRADPTRGSAALPVIGPPLELPEGPPVGRADVALARQRLRSGGHELHGVREHQPGESLRGVHWPSTAHHGRLMVKELDDPAGDELAVVLDARASADVGSPPDSSFELAVAAAGALVARAHDEGRRARLVVAGLDGEPAGAGERTAVRRLLARVRPGGERSPGDLLARLAAERVEVVTSRPAALIGALGRRELGVVAIDPSSFDAAVPRDAAAIEALRAAGCRVLELRRPEPGPMVAAEERGQRALALRGALYAIACAFGLLHARDLQTPALSTARLAAMVVLATAPALVALRAGRRLGLLALAPAAIVAAYVAAGHWPSPGAPLGGLAGQLLDAPGTWVQVVLPFGAAAHPELRAAVLLALFAWVATLAWVWLVRPRPLLAALLAALPFAISATVYDLPQYPWRALLAGGLLFAFLYTGRAAGGGRTLACAFALLALAGGVGWAAVPAASRPAVLPWTTWTFSHTSRDASSVDLVWDMSYRPLSFPSKPVEVLQVRAPRASYWRAVVLAGFDGLRFTRLPQGVSDASITGDLRVVAPPPGPRLRAEVRVKALSDRFLVAPAQPVRYEVPLSAGPAYLGEDGTAFLSDEPESGLAYVSEGADRNPSARALGALPGGYPARVEDGLRFAGEVLPAFGSAGREQQMAAVFQAHAGDPSWSAWQVAYAKARAVTRGAASPYQAVVALEAWLRTSRAYDEHASLPDRPDALARWAAFGKAGYCQMFAASLAALSRLAGVPARVAEGFAPGDRRGGVFHVTDRDAHAWVEAWFPGYGWLPFDATPGRELPARASSSSASFDGRAAQAPPSGDTRTTAPLQLPLAQLQAVLAAGRPGETAASAAWWGTPYALALAVVAALLAALALLKRGLVGMSLPRDPAGAARGLVVAFVADQGVDLSNALTPRELGAVLAERFGVEAEGFAGALERSAYAAPAEENAARLGAETTALLGALRSALGPLHRLRGAFSARSISASRARAR